VLERLPACQESTFKHGIKNLSDKKILRMKPHYETYGKTAEKRE